MFHLKFILENSTPSKITWLQEYDGVDEFDH